MKLDRAGNRDRVRDSARIGRLGRKLRKPWYGWWRFVERKLFRGRSYTLQVPSGHRVYTPWFDDASGSEFAEILRTVRGAGPLAMSADRCYMLYQFSRRALRLHGDVAECGVYVGGTAHLLGEVISRGTSAASLHLFDTFGGMPVTLPSRDYHVAGQFSDTSLERVQRRLSSYAFCRFHPGLIPQTFGDVAGDMERLAFVHVDVDIYSSTLECLRWLWPRLVSGGAMVVDDYGFYPYRHAARSAVDDFFAQEEEGPIVLSTGQALVLKT